MAFDIDKIRGMESTLEQVRRIERDLERARVDSVRSTLESIRPALDTLAKTRSAANTLNSVQRTMAGLERNSLAQALRPQLVGISPYESILSGPAFRSIAAMNARPITGINQAVIRAARAGNFGSVLADQQATFGAARVASAAVKAFGPIPLEKTLKSIAPSISAAQQAGSIVGRMSGAWSPLRESLTMTGYTRNFRVIRGIASAYSAASLDFASIHRQQEQINKVLDSFKGLGVLSNAAHASVLYGTQTPNSAAWRAILRSATSYGPTVVTPEGPAPAPPKRTRRRAPDPDYGPNLQPKIIPVTATKVGDPIPFEVVWLVAISCAQAIARYHGTRVVVRFIGDHQTEILIGIATNLASQGIIWLWLSL